MVAYRSTATNTQTTGTDGTTFNITKPSGTASGDALVVVLHGYLPTTLTVPSGFVQIAGPIADGTALYSWLYQKIATGSEPASYTFTWSGTGGAIGGSMTAFSSTSGVSGWYAKVTTATDPSVGQAITPVMTSLGYHVLAWRDATADTNTASGVTEIFDFNSKDSGTIFRGQAGYVDTSTTTTSGTISGISIDPTNSVERGIHWTIAMGDTVTNQSYSSSGQAVELYVNSAWTDITGDVQYEEGISITRGQSGEGSEPDTSRMSLTLDNRTGKYSPRNPSGTYYGSIGRNTPIRVAKAQGTVSWQADALLNEYGRTNSFAYERFHTVDKTSLMLSGDIDVRVDVEPKSWNTSNFLMGKFSLDSAYAGLKSWAFATTTDGKLYIEWSTDGTTVTNSATSTANIPTDKKRRALRVTVDVDNGAAGNTVTFYYADTISGSWTQLGNAVTTAGTTSFYSANPSMGLTVGAENQDTDDGATTEFSVFKGKFYAAQLRSGIAGTTVASIDFTTLSSGTATFTDSQNNIWNGLEGALATNRRYRFWGEVSNWPQKWDTTGSYIYTPIEASGIRRRLETGSTPVKSAVYRDMIARTSPTYKYNQIIAYWPCEDLVGSTSIASALPNGYPMSISGSPTFEADTNMPGSNPVLQLNNASLSGTIANYTSTGQISMRFYVNRDTSLSTLQDICTLTTAGTARKWTIGITATSALYLTFTDSDGNSTTDVLNSLIDFGTWGTPSILAITLELTQNGSNVDYVVRFTNYYGSDYITNPSVSSDTGTMNSVTLGRATKVTIEPNLKNFSVGHIAVGDSTTVFTSSATAITGEAQEKSRSRFTRLLEEEDLNFQRIGESATLMGVQGVKTLMDLVKECADSEHGIMYEPRSFLGLGLYTLPALYNKPSALELDYSLFHLSNDLFPEEDDQLIRNDITVERDGGSSARYSLDSGKLSTQAPPNGVGRYDESVTLSLNADSVCDDHAAWLVNLGTIDEARYPTVGIALENKRFVASSSLTEAALNVDIGDRITIANPPSWIPPETISLMVVGYSETIDQFQHNISFVCVPASRYDQIGVVEDTTDSNARVDTDASSLAASATAGATSLSVATTDGYRWIDSATYSSDFPFDIMVGGERMTVTAITGTSSPQTFTVTRAVNGISKAQTSGTEVHVFEPMYVAF